MSMNQILMHFIEDNILLIEQDTKESWEAVYDEIPFGQTGNFTKQMLDAGINPLDKLDQIPDDYLRQIRTTEFTVPPHITRIGTSAFFSTSLEKITLNDKLEEIYTGAFERTNLTELVIPKSVNYIGDYVFSYTYSLKEIHYQGTCEEWDKVYTCSDWLDECNVTKVICLDGVIDL